MIYFLKHSRPLRLSPLMLFSLQRPMGVSLKQFDGLMRFYRPRMSARDRFLTYKALNTSGAPMLRWHTLFQLNSSSLLHCHTMLLDLCLFCYSLQDFYKFYEVTGLKWKVSSFTLVLCSYNLVCFVYFGLFWMYMCVCFRRDAVENTGLMTFHTRPSSFLKVLSLFLLFIHLNVSVAQFLFLSASFSPFRHQPACEVKGFPICHV